MTDLSLAIDIRKVRGDSAQSVTDRVAVEEPLEIRVGYSVPAGRTATSVSVTMRTPGNDAELALGFLYSESIIRSNSDVVAIDHSGPAAPDSGNRNIIRIDLADGVIPDLERLQRNFYTTSSCGVCGKSSLDALRVIGATRLTMIKRQFSRTALIGLPDALRDQQATFKETGGLHAAAAFNSHGDIEVVREDVGRHNAVDKVVGALLQEERLPAADCGLIVSGRASFELLQKTLVAGIPLLAAVSAPSSLAVRLAQEFDVTLVGFLRGDAFNIYSAGERIS